MDYSEFRSHAIQSAELYYQYLKENNKGYSTVEVRAIEPLPQANQYRLHLVAKLFDPSAVQIMVLGLIYSLDEIETSQYDDQNKTLDIRVNNGALDSATPPEDVSVVSDLKFLVRRVRDWYSKQTKPLQLPACSPNIRPDPATLTVTLSGEQQTALDGIFANPFTYIWGAPGTGKTQYVLAQAVLTYCLAGRQILIVAPTNNAVEQTLRGVLPVLEKAGIPLSRVLRFGTPSKAFLEQYPMVCEIPSVEREMEQITERLSFLKKAHAYFDTIAWLDATQKAVATQREAVEQIVSRSNAIRSKIADLQVERKTLQNDFAPLYDRIDQLDARHASLSSYLSKRRGRLSRWLLSRHLCETEQKLSSVSQELSKYRNEQDFGLLQYEQLNREISVQNAELHSLSEQIENCYIQLDQQFQRSPVPDFGSRLTSSFMPFQDFSSLAASLEQIALEVQGRSAPYQDLSLKDVNSEEAALLEKTQQLGGVSAVARLPDALVVAATVDGFIGKVSYLSDLHPHHVFLDEAAYCPLIKAFTLFSQEVPITFLGDHKQLPPVCEADDRLFKQSEHMPIFLFAQSALYCESIFHRSFDQLFAEYMDSSDLELHTMSRFDLLHTFRFGESLAQVLARFVYTPQFRGNEAIQTNITILHAPHCKAEREKNSSLDEAKMIAAYLQQNPCEDFAVITPYRNQKKQLVQHARGIYALDRISTIHGSQGQEWDTVFFSVTSVSPNRFLSNTLINTAVSRAKKHLIIVCDRTCWNRYPDSFLGSLIASGK